MLIINELSNFYRCKRGEILFHAITRGDYSGWYFKELKKSRDYARIQTDRLMVATIRCASHFAKKGRFDIITTPPDSGQGESFAGMVAKEVSTAADIDFVKIFQDHDKGKRQHVRIKFQNPIKFELTTRVKGSRILIIDDFTQTNGTMVGAICALFEDNQVAGLVLWTH